MHHSVCWCSSKCRGIPRIYMLMWHTTRTLGADQPGILLVMIPIFHLFQLLHSSTLFLFSQAVSCLTKKKKSVWFLSDHKACIYQEKKEGSIFFLHLYYFYCSGMPQVLSQTCCLLFLTLPSANQILYAFCGAVQRWGNLLLFLADRSSLMHTDSSEKRDTSLPLLPSSSGTSSGLWVCSTSEETSREKVLTTPASQVVSTGS